MTDEEIKKALECCKNGNPCSSCPYNGKCTDEDFNDNYLIKDVIALINRQQAEIERLAARFNEYPVKVMTGDNAEIYAKSTADYEKLIEDISNIGGEKAGERIMTNYERIKNMSIDQMTNFLHDECDGVCECCVFNRNANCYENTDKCKLGIKEWLESEVEE